MDIVRIVRGTASKIRAANSDVILHTPEGLHAVVLGNIHVNHAPFQHLVPSNECIVGPICEYSVHGMIHGPIVEGKRYKLMIPHILTDVDKLKHHIRLRHVHIHGKVQVIDEETKNPDVNFAVNKNYVTIYTSHFSKYIVTVEGINCCSGSANMLLFGSLTNVQEAEPMVTLKVYMSSKHMEIRDYESVSRSAIYNFQ